MPGVVSVPSPSDSQLLRRYGQGERTVLDELFQRYRLLRELRVARITVEELRQKQQAGENVFILDLRSNTELHLEPSGSRHQQ